MDLAYNSVRPDADGPARKRGRETTPLIKIVGRYHQLKGRTNLSPAAVKEIDARVEEDRARSKEANVKIDRELRDAGIVVDADELPPKPIGKQVLDAFIGIGKGIIKAAVRVREIADGTDKKNVQLAAYGRLPEEVKETVVITSE